MNKKKILSLILVVVFAFQLFAVVACADDGQKRQHGDNHL